ncbi:MAG: DUF2892 domain-containing protein [Sulfobacillus sp.]|nr:DUF2892 domain-containing protein [Sulfobacillus sp.]
MPQDRLIPNVAPADRALRSAVAIFLLFWAWRGALVRWQVVGLGVLDGLLWSTVLTGYCLVYRWLGIRTNHPIR